METKVKNNGQATVATTTVNADKKPQFVAGNPVNAVSNAEPVKEVVKKDAEKKPATTAVQAPPQPEPAKAETAKADVKAEPVKEEPKKFVLNLEGTLKFIEEMHRKAKQRGKLQETIKNLDDFEVELRDEADSADTNYYTGCTLTLTDDRNRKFETKNPTIIWTVAQLVNNMCVDKLAEIEAGIVIPQ
ncbi:hypothetical protein [Mucilaginibacter polytrichastri]|uniref:Uncharacterized protein n=1 Tax=Mucilaginibacter polytrichastri TaxID=1302689 RepID=A0A1Q5ZWF6_9SPHI|nr:hypothetical protein [Mucilaginibacter polytrichastri]OKS86114.1 hypothetical protein RG47T_1564 [Mucilaginibacter polytrichastri]SFS58592.1 hypothetical protein SAMN04487890_10227 [Mucilaginibacter polytrichastri]